MKSLVKASVVAALTASFIFSTMFSTGNYGVKAVKANPSFQNNCFGCHLTLGDSARPRPTSTPTSSPRSH
jgi:hypothetical protein